MGYVLNPRSIKPRYLAVAAIDANGDLLLLVPVHVVKDMGAQRTGQVLYAAIVGVEVLVAHPVRDFVHLNGGVGSNDTGVAGEQPGAKEERWPGIVH